MDTLSIAVIEVAAMTDEDAIRDIVLDYVEGWFDGDAQRIERALHPQLVKRCRGIEGDDPDALETLTQRDMIDATAEGIGREEDAEDRRISIEITNLSDGVASVTCLCHRYVDLLQLIRMPEGWRIINAAWCMR
jgi:Putative lumazine-binding